MLDVSFCDIDLWCIAAIIGKCIGAKRPILKTGCTHLTDFVIKLTLEPLLFLTFILLALTLTHNGRKEWDRTAVGHDFCLPRRIALSAVDQTVLIVQR